MPRCDWVIVWAVADCKPDACAYYCHNFRVAVQIAPVMGAGYHTIHHTLYNYNYGHYFTFVDRLFGTLITPEELEEKKAADAAAAAAAKAQ